MIYVAAYCRVSTDKSDQANSFEAQKRYFREYISVKSEWSLYGIYADEGITGTSTRKRTQFNKMIHDARNGQFSLILTKEVSRFSRNILDTILYTRQLRSVGVGVIFLTDRINTMDPEAEMLLSFLASMAQEESRKTSARVTWGQTRQMERGVVFGPSLLGYTVKGGRIAVNPAEAGTVRLIFHKYALEQAGATEIARYLMQNGYLTHAGNAEWSANSVIKILKNEKYVGDLTQKKSYTPNYLSHEKKKNRGEVPFICHENHHTPIISREVWNMTQERLLRNRKKTNCKCGHSSRYILSGKIKCGECGGTFVCRTKYLADGSKVRRWSCRNAAYGGAASCRIGKLLRDDDGIQMLKTAIESLDLDIAATVQSVVNTVKQVRHGENSDVLQTNREITRLETKKKRLLDSFCSGDISNEEMSALRAQYDGQLAALRASMSLAEASNNQQLPDILDKILTGKMESEAFYRTVLDTLTVYKDGKMDLKLAKFPQVFRFSF